MSSDLRIILKGIQQFLLLSFLVTLPIFTIFYDLIYTQQNLLNLEQGLSEYSMTEYLQESLLFFTTLSFAYTAYKSAEIRHFCVLVTGFFACMLIRELDGFLDNIRHGFWVYPATLVALFSIIYALKAPDKTINAFAKFVQSRHFVTLNIGMTLLLVFSRIFGIGELWQGILGPDYERIIKRVVEEGLEVLGYTIIFYAAMGYLNSFLVCRKAKSSKAIFEQPVDIEASIYRYNTNRNN